MVLLRSLSSTVHVFPSLQLGVVEWGINPNLPTMSGYICGFTSMPASSQSHGFLRGNCTLEHVFASISLEAHSHRSVPESRIPHTAAQQGPAPLQGPDHSALICFPNLSLTRISAVTQKAASHMDHLSVFISTLFLGVLSLSLHLYVSVSLSRCNPLLWWAAYGADAIGLAEYCCGCASKLSARILNAPCLCFTHLHSQPSPQLSTLHYSPTH